MNNSELFLIKNIFIGLILFSLFILNLVAVNKRHIRFRWFVKPMIVPAIIGFYLLNTNEANFRWVVIIALAFGLVGDIFLLIRKSAAFLVGLVAFLAGHVLYIAIFLYLSDFPENVNLPLILIGSFLLLTLIPVSILLIKFAKKMSYPAILYYSLLMMMCFSACTLYGNISLLAFCLTMSGSILFVLSDTILGVRKFTSILRDNTLLVMATYFPAQLLIAIGMVLA